MALDPTLTTATASAACDAVVDRLDTGGAGTLKIYSGTQPVTADTGIVAQVLLATLTFSATAFGNAASGVATAAAITDDASADATGTATWARWANGAGTTILDCTVGTSGCDINLNSAAIVIGAAVSITSLIVTVPLT